MNQPDFEARLAALPRHNHEALMHHVLVVGCPLCDRLALQYDTDGVPRPQLVDLSDPATLRKTLEETREKNRGELAFALRLDDQLEDLGMHANDRLTCHTCQSWADHGHDPISGRIIPMAANGAKDTSANMTSLGLTRQELRAEIDELIRNAYVEGWREAKRRPETEPPALKIDWTQPGGVRVTELWCVCDVQGSALSASCKVHGAKS